MAAPTPTARATPVGRKLKEGFPVKITIAADTDISFWEKSVTPVGFDGGDSIDQSTMFNTRYRTKAARTLIDTTDVTVTKGTNGARTITVNPKDNQNGEATITLQVDDLTLGTNTVTFVVTVCTEYRISTLVMIVNTQ